MANEIPCPNPACTQVFSQSVIKRSPILACPSCGQVFELRATAAPAPLTPNPPKAQSPPVKAAADMPAVGKHAIAKPSPPPAKPAAKPAMPPAAKPMPPAAKPAMPRQPVPAAPKPAAAPLATPVAARQLDVPASAAPALDVLAPDAPLLRSRKVHEPWGWKQYIFAGLGGLAVLLLMLGAYIAYTLLPTDTDEVDPGFVRYPATILSKQNQRERVFQLVLPADKWDEEPELRAGLGMLTAMRHAKADSWFAVAADDFGTRNPRSAELVNLGIDKLRKFYALTLELGEKAEPAQFAGEQAHHLEFKGQHKNVTHRGELYMFARNGIGYWLVIAGPTVPEAQKVLDELQSGGRGFVFLTERRGWREQPPKRDTFTGRKYAYTVSAPADVWEGFSALDEDERGDVFLLGRYLKERDNRKNASVLTLFLGTQENAKEALKTARTYIEGKKQEEDKSYRFVPAGEGSEQGRTADVGNKRGLIGEYKVLLGDEPMRYVMIAVVNDPGYAFVWRGDCRWEHRQIWQQDFLDLLATLRLPKGE